MSKELEVWKVAKYNDMTFDGYEVSSLGRIRSYKRSKTPKILKPVTNQSGYYQLILSKDGKKYCCRINRLVLFSFQEIPENYQELEANHLNQNITDNRLCNLNWLSKLENIRYGDRAERVAKTQTNRKDLSKTVYQYSLAGEFIKEWASLKEVERELGFANSNISACCLGKYKTAYGFKWSYEPQLPTD